MTSTHSQTTPDPTLAAVMRFAPPGHFYSPHPNLSDLERGEHAAAVALAEDTTGLDLNAPRQLELFRSAASQFSIGPWEASRRAPLRHYYENHFFRFGDSNAVYHMAASFRPSRIVEIGSGFSTACWLDSLDQLQLNAAIDCIEPYPDRLRELCSTDDLNTRLRLHECPLQAIPIELFEQLGKNDVLFIDSTHVSKCGSDVNRLFFSILPRLKSGVLVHIHDIFWPFEYPLDWYREGRTWNEAYLLRAFLTFNSAFEIVRFNSYLAHEFPDALRASDARFVSESGGSIWLRRL